MNFWITVLQIFYDVTGRLFAGLLFLVLLSFQLTGTVMTIPQQNQTNSLAALLDTFAYMVLCYFTGWVLRAFNIRSFEKKIRNKIDTETVTRAERGLDPNHKSLPINTRFQRIRLKSEAAGFRIVKLRAEARMLETSRAGMAILSVIGVIILMMEYGLMDGHAGSHWLLGLSKVIIPIVLYVRFRRCEKSAWENYFGNIQCISSLLFVEDLSNQTSRTPSGWDAGT